VIGLRGAKVVAKNILPQATDLLTEIRLTDRRFLWLQSEDFCHSSETLPRGGKGPVPDWQTPDGWLGLISCWGWGASKCRTFSVVGALGASGEVPPPKA
jgi:hypothetical protein